MDQATLETLIPIVAIVCGAGFIPAILFITRYFRLKDRELQIEAEAQRWNEKHYAALEMRVQRLETLLSLEARSPSALPAAGAAEAPATGQTEARSPEAPPLKLR